MRRPPEALPLALVAVIVLAHAVYGLLLIRSPLIATAHAVATFLAAIWIAATSTVRRISFACAYLAGCQLLWRIGHAVIPWEFAKYAICLLAVIALARVKRLRWDWLSLAYLGLLVPSTLLSFVEESFSYARQQVSFNMSGPLTLAITTWFASLLRPTRADIQRLFLALLAPAVSLGAIALTGTIKLEDLTFSDASNFQTSAGYGPNQVSTILGLGSLVAFLLVFLVEEDLTGRVLFGAVAAVLAAQCALTFSRGGLYSEVGALMLAAPFLIHGSRKRVALFIGALVFVAGAELVVLPRLDALTGGALAERFADTNPTGRDELIRQEITTFEEHPVFGVGPAALDRHERGTIAVHTEFSRLLAQHGIFGAFALLAMFALCWRAFIRQSSSSARAITVALLSWSLLTMTHAAMRLAVIPFAFGLAAASFFATPTRRSTETLGPSAAGAS